MAQELAKDNVEKIKRKNGDVIEVLSKDGLPVTLTLDTIASYLATPNGLNPWIEDIRTRGWEARGDAEISSEDGRDKIRSAAYAVARSKNAVLKLKTRWREQQMGEIYAADAEGRRFDDECEKIQKEIRKPLTDWEEVDKKRKTKHEADLKALNSLLDFTAVPCTIAEIEARLTTLHEECDGQGECYNWEEYAELAARTIAGIDKTLREKLVALETEEAEHQEALRARAELEQEQQRAREQQIRTEARTEAEAEFQQKLVKSTRTQAQDATPPADSYEQASRRYEVYREIHAAITSALALTDLTSNQVVLCADILSTAIDEGRIPHVCVTY
jgi:hypothetical protein